MWTARSALLPGIGALTLGLLAGACSDDTADPPTQLPPLELTILEPGPEVGPVTAGQTVRFRGEARAEDLGALPEDSVWWTLNGELLARGYEAEAIISAGEHEYAFHARVRTRSGVAPRRVLGVSPPPPEPGEILWSVSVGEGNGYGGLSMGVDGTLVTVAGDGASVVAIDSRGGSVLWKTDTGYGIQLTSPPTVTRDGDVYIGGRPFGDGGLIALGAGGEIHWVLRGDDHFSGESRYGYTAGGVAVDEAGMLYLGVSDDRSPFLSVRPDGTVRWTVTASDSIQYGLWSGPVLAAGKVFMLERKRDLVAYDRDGAGEIWRMEVLPPGLSGYHNFPAVLGDGTLVILRDRFLWGISPDGTLRWKTEVVGDYVEGPRRIHGASAVVSTDRIFVKNDAGGVRVFSLQGEALEAWGPESQWLYRGTPVLGARGVVYVMGSAHPDGPGYLRSYAPDGTLRWQMELPDHEANDFIDTGSPVVGDDGTVYLRTSAGKVLAVADTVGPAIHAQWPELRGGPARWGRRQQR